MNSPLNRDAGLHLADLLSDEVTAAPAGELLAEVAEDFGDRRALAREFDAVFARAVAQTRTRRIRDYLREYAIDAFTSPSWKSATATVLSIVLIVGGLYAANHFTATEKTQALKVASPDPYSLPTSDAPQASAAKLSVMSPDQGPRLPQPEAKPERAEREFHEAARKQPFVSPAQLGRITVVDLVAYECGAAPSSTPIPNADPAIHIEVGSCIAVQVASGITGHLAVFGRNAEGRIRQIFPNEYHGGSFGLVDTSPTRRVQVGEVITIPEPGAGFELSIRAPLGRNEIIAVIVPERMDLEKIAEELEGTRSVDKFEDLLASLAKKAGVDISS